MPTVEAVADDCATPSSARGPGRLLRGLRRHPYRTIVGTVAAVPDPDESCRGHLQALYVDPGHWGRGIGRRCTTPPSSHLRAAGFRVAVLWVLEANVRARAMYERWGWRATPRRQTDYPGVDEICYLRSL